MPDTADGLWPAFWMMPQDDAYGGWAASGEIDIMEAANDLEAIGDIIETNLAELGRQRIESGVTVSSGTREIIERYHAAVSESLGAALLAVTQKNDVAARAVVELEVRIKEIDVEVLDEFGDATMSGMAHPDRVRIAYAILNHRANYFLPTLVTTNLHPLDDADGGGSDVLELAAFMLDRL